VNRPLYVAVRAIVRTANTPFAKARLTRALARSQRPLKIEIGGLKRRPGWVVTNVNAVTRNYMDATSRWPVEDGAASHVYSDNVIEHLPLAAGRAMFAEAHRVLRPGGRIRLVTPDIRRHVQLYLDGSTSVTGPVGNTYRDLGLVVEYPVDLIRIPIGQFGHHEGYLYDLETLQLELERAGFHSVNQVQLGQSDDPVLVGLDTRADEGGAQFAVEAVR
jgi:predicted SAM-dependent methyltransferase